MHLSREYRELLAVGSVLRHLSMGRPKERALEGARRTIRSEAWTIESLLDRASDLLDRHELSAPARAGFLTRSLVPPGRLPAARDDDDLLQQLEGHARETIADTVADRPLDPAAAPVRSAALQYAAALSAEARRRAFFADDPGALHQRLPAADRSRVEDWMVFAQTGCRSLDGLLESWERAAAAFVKHPQTWYYDDLVQFLGRRDHLDRVSALVTELPDEVAQRVAEADRVYLAATVEHPRSLRWRGSRWEPKGWWWYRRPREVGADMAEWLAAND